MYDVKTISSYFIDKANKIEIDEWVFEWISHLKLQKILYFSQAIFMAVKWTPAFIEKIYAWKYWPVVKEIYDEYSKNRKMWNRLLSQNEILDNDFNNIITLEDKKILFNVWAEFWQFSANQLVNITHKHSPWKNAYKELQEIWWKESWISIEITTEVLKNYYSWLIEVK
jgi:uncharacterized phage-associated protein